MSTTQPTSHPEDHHHPDDDVDFDNGFIFPRSGSLRKALAAIRGQAIPKDFDKDSPDTNLYRRSLVRGIRKHPGFATSLYGVSPVFSRAINARKIMSNEIPEIESVESTPYCIWYPETATEDTYRSLAARYPQLRYNVGRACAVAGYTALYQELNLLPDISIAEEAFDNGHLEIYNLITSSPVRYAVMDDYTLTVDTDSPRAPAFLNCDTAVRSYLAYRNNFAGIVHPYIFDIEEDHKIAASRAHSSNSKQPFKADATPYLYALLPPDLPPLNKDLLIYSSAYYGNMERYSRLRRPTPRPSEPACLIRGIYHSTPFAKWCSTSLSPVLNENPGIIRAIHARSIMNNDLSNITSNTPSSHMPYMIWYPSLPHGLTLLELVRRQPGMRQAAARACIVARDAETWEKLDPSPDEYLLAEARVCLWNFFAEDLDRRVAERGMLPPTYVEREYLRSVTVQDARESSGYFLLPGLTGYEFLAGTEGGWNYDGAICDFGAINLAVSAYGSDTAARTNEPVSLEQLYPEPAEATPSADNAN
ncbi:hypothetical protein DRE_00963 [Drechslerella stenobrocha 248]|uniref:Uncharacterized protein n=1 Tax=Drechslerella stenobrocha 248 TaxID=1043628 RepID=W7HP24_9PEZI|nr:hypothetical protein DRE_00963 [Drechslerella stenobrocha 248]